MGMSAFEILIVPILWGTLDGFIVGAAALTLMNAIEWLAGRGSRANQSIEAIPRPLARTQRPFHRATKA